MHSIPYHSAYRLLKIITKGQQSKSEVFLKKKINHLCKSQFLWYEYYKTLPKFDSFCYQNVFYNDFWGSPYVIGCVCVCVYACACIKMKLWFCLCIYNVCRYMVDEILAFFTSHRPS